MDLENFNKDQHLSYEELLAYQQAKLSNREMHRLELHLVDCELCNDALEGIGQIQESVLEKHISSLKVKTGVHNVGRITTRQWLAAAASLSIIAIIGIIYFSRPEKNEMLAEKIINVEEKEKPMLKSAAPVELKNDSITDSLRVDRRLLASSDSIIPREEQTVSSPAAQTEPIITITDSVSEPELFTQTESDSSAGIIADLAEDKSDSANLFTVVTDAEPALVDEEIVSSSSRMAATGAAERTQEVTDDANKKALITDDYKRAEPEQGIRAYNRYLKRKMNYPQAALDNNIEGEVILEVTIDDNGEITNIEITQVLGFGCDQEAIRLVREGPKWQAASRNGSNILDKVIIKVAFNP